jgi:ABC-type Fe3+/spermidine/putrescine transport system ATPase subunit
VTDKPIDASAVAERPAGMEPRRPLVRLRGVARRFAAVEAVRPLDLDIHAGDFLAVLGPSGCGKTTLLRLIGGFLAPSAGSIEIDGVDVTRLGPERRPTNMVFQGYGLFPHMNVRRNISYGLRLAKRPRPEIDRRVDEIAALGRLADLLDREVHQLSGGQQQRVALARALVMRPKVLLLDEPLAALDLKLRQAMQEELRRLHREIGGTFVFVTHDQGEALGLANRIAVMEAGRIVQVGAPEDIYGTPDSRFVSTFIGEANMIPGRRAGGAVALAEGARFPSPGPDGPVTVIVRPQRMRMGEGDAAGDVRLPGRIEDAVFLGSYRRYRVRLDCGPEVDVHDLEPDRLGRLPIGARVQVAWRLADQRVLDGE